MGKKWTIPKLIAIGSLAILGLVLGLSGSVIQAVTGIPGSAVITLQLIGPMTAVLTSMLIQQFGACTIMFFVFMTCALPLPLAGPPGYLPKIVIGLLLGLGYDTLFLLFKKWERLAAAVGGAYGPSAAVTMILGAGRLFSVPGIPQLAKILMSPLVFVALIIGGMTGGSIGLFIYNKIRNTTVVSRIQAGSYLSEGRPVG